MDIRLFKILMLVGVELLLGVASFIEYRYFSGSRIGSLLFMVTRNAMISFPVLVLLPEENWIWLVEEDPRGRKITLRSKASKHLHLSMLYFLLIGYPCFLICISLFMKWDKYRFPPAMILIGYAVIYGIYCAVLNFRNVKKYDSLFAVAWDRRSSFVEIFVGVKVAKEIKMFYKGFSLYAGLLLLLGSAFASYFFYNWIYPGSIVEDREKFIVMQTTYCIMLAFSVWVMSMYLFFQLFYSRKLEAWVRTKNRKKTGDEK